MPIPGTTKLRRLEENVGAASVALTPTDLATIAAALTTVTVQGDHYPAHLQARVSRLQARVSPDSRPHAIVSIDD